MQGIQVPCDLSLPTMNPVKKNALYLTALQGFNYVLPLVTVVYLVRIFGPGGYGRLALAHTYIQFFGILVDYGFALSATRLVAQHQARPAAIRTLFRAVILAKLLLAATALPVMLALAWWIPSLHANLLLCCAYYLSVLGGVFVPSWIYQGYQRMGVLTVLTAAPRLLTTAAILLLIHRSNQLVSAAVLLCAAPVISGLAGLVHCRIWLGLRLGRVPLAEIAAQFRAGWHVFLATASGALYTLSPTFVLGLVAAPAVVGYFAAAERLMKAAQNLFSPISQAVYPHLARLFAESRNNALELLGQLLLLVLAAYGALVIACELFPTELLGLVFGERFMQAAVVLRILCFLPLLGSVNIISGALYLVPLNRGQTLSRSVVAPTIVHVALIYPVASHAGPVGIAALLVLTELTILLIRVDAARRHDRGDLKSVTQGLLKTIGGHP